MNMTFLSCPPDLSWSSLPVVTCLSNSRNLILATSSFEASSYALMCRKLFVRLIPRTLTLRTPDGYVSELEGDLPLKWNVPYCVDCEFKNQTCGFENNSSLQVTCLHISQKGNKGLRAFGIFVSCAFFLAISVAISICFMKGSQRLIRMTATTDQPEVIPHPVYLTAGLDETTIQSYTKVVLGKSCRLPGGTSDGTCPICLSEFTPKETVKSIPECKHCFHADCIDEWLRLTSTCPICRITPTPSPIHADL